ncbi:hypothetical protein KI387_044626, partial [Taxus chinensis]
MAGSITAVTVTVTVTVMCIMMVLGGAEGTGSDCNSETAAIAPCSEYLLRGSPVPILSDNCCSGVMGIYSQATTTPLMQSLCNCLKNEANQFDVIDMALQNLAPTCGVHLDFVVSKNINCS